MNKNERGLQGSQGGPSAGQSVLRVGEERGVELPFSTFEQRREYRRFVQVCEAAGRYRYLVVCVGDRGVGKTWAAREYAQWAVFERLLTAQGVAFPAECPMPRTAYYRPKATSTPKSIEQDLALLLWGLQMIADHASAVAQERRSMSVMIRPDVVDVVIVDEVDGLSQASLEVLRDVFDRSRVGMVLLGHSGSAERWLKMAALSSRVGMLHAFGSLGPRVAQRDNKKQAKNPAITPFLSIKGGQRNDCPPFNVSFSSRDVNADASV